MTLLQIKAVVFAAQFGSISLAAKQLGISQSNVSAYIKDIEKELDVKLLIRNRNGIIPTEQGSNFIEHGKKILAEQELISNINKLKQFRRLRVGSMNFSLARDIFNQICIDNVNSGNIDMLYTNVSLTKGIDMLHLFQLDIFVGFIRSDLIEKANWMMEIANVEKKHLGTMYPYIRFRKNHPLVQCGINKDGTINISALENYPYIDYESFKDDCSGLAFDNNFESGGIHQIYICDDKSRYEIMSKSNAYSMGIRLNRSIEEKYNLTSVPIRDLTAEYCVLTRSREISNPLLKEYIDLLEESGKDVLK